MKASITYPRGLKITNAWVILLLNRFRLPLLSHSHPNWATGVAQVCKPGWIDNILTLDSSLRTLWLDSLVKAGQGQDVALVPALWGKTPCFTVCQGPSLRWSFFDWSFTCRLFDPWSELMNAIFIDIKSKGSKTSVLTEKGFCRTSVARLSKSWILRWGSPKLMMRLLEFFNKCHFLDIKSVMLQSLSKEYLKPLVTRFGEIVRGGVTAPLVPILEVKGR